MGLSSRKQNLALYMMTGLEHHKASLEQLGKYKTGKSCLYVKDLKDIGMTVLKSMMDNTVKTLKGKK